MNEDLDSILETKQEPTTKETKEGGFFSFRTMISTTLIKIIYVLGMIGLTICGIVIIKQANGSIIILLRGIAVIVFSNLLWRLICEWWILLFSIYDILGSIEKELKRK